MAKKLIAGVRLQDLETPEQIKLRYLLRNAADNGIVEAGAAFKFGSQWYVDPERLQDFLRMHTLAVINGTRTNGTKRKAEHRAATQDAAGESRAAK